MGGGTLVLSGTNTLSQWGGNNGVMTIPSGGLLNNRDGNLTSGGGGLITINSGGTLNADSAGQGESLEPPGSLLVNNGTVVGTTNVGYGATATGGGTFGPLNVCRRHAGRFRRHDAIDGRAIEQRHDQRQRRAGGDGHDRHDRDRYARSPGSP